MNEQARQPPHNLSAEQAVLGAILMNNDVIESMSSFLREDHFHFREHQEIFGAAIEIFNEGKAATPVSLRMYLSTDQFPEQMTAQQYLARLAVESVPASLAMDYARLLVDLAHRRQIASSCSIAADLAYTAPPTFKPAQMASSVIDELDSIIVKSAAAIPRMSLGQAAERAIKAAQDTAAGKPHPGISTGLRTLDRRLGGGLMPGELVIIAGRPGAGKTALMISAGINVSKRGEGVLAVSLEMGAEELGQRAVSSLCYRPNDPIEYQQIRRAKELTDRQFERMVDAQRDLADVPFVIEWRGGLMLSQIGTIARRVAAQLKAKGTELRLLVVDHLGLIKASTKYNSSREREVAEISMGLKVLAKELGIPVVALAQLSRAVEARQDKRPMLSDLRESGSIEQDADVVIGLYRAAYYLKGKDNLTDEERLYLLDHENEMEAIILKNRAGPTSTVPLACFIGSNVISDPVLDHMGGGYAQGEIAGW